MGRQAWKVRAIEGVRVLAFLLLMVVLLIFILPFEAITGAVRGMGAALSSVAGGINEVVRESSRRLDDVDREEAER